MSTISRAIYTAVLYRGGGTVGGSGRNADEDEEQIRKTSSSLREPLLARSTTGSSKKSATKKKKTREPAVGTASPKDGEWQDPYPSLWRLKVLSFVTGSITAAVSQAILGSTLWVDNGSFLAANQQQAMRQPDPEGDAPPVDGGGSDTLSVVGFSLLWSFWTCVMIFIAMLALVRAVLGSAPPPPPPSSSAGDGNGDIEKETEKRRQRQEEELRYKVWEDTVFQMEAHHIVGALLSISAIWVAVDVLQSVFVAGDATSSTWSAVLALPSPCQNALLLVLGLAWYGLFVRCILKKSSGESQQQKEGSDEDGSNAGLLSTYQLIASTLGLISGLCSQFLLSFLLWKDNMSQPVVDHVIAFSVLWSFCTVVLTFLGCLSLRFLTVEDDDEDGDGGDKLVAERTFLRMESHYIFCSLIGICSAWILIDLVMGMEDQIFPSVLMLALSLAAFGGIVRCFPEDQCLADLRAEADATVALVEHRDQLELLRDLQGTPSAGVAMILQIV